MQINRSQRQPHLYYRLATNPYGITNHDINDHRRPTLTFPLADTYETLIPPHLPPTFRGKSLTFTYTLELSLTLSLPAEPPPPPPTGRWSLFGTRRVEEKVKTVQREVEVPIRVIPRVTGTS